MSLKKQSKFSLLFDKHYKRLYNYSFKLLKDENSSHDVVQDTFITLWEKIEHIENNPRSITSFLIITLKNKIIDHIRKENTKNKHIKLYNLNKSSETEIENKWELLKIVEDVYNTLPAKTSEIFRLSRDKSLTYKEIAELKKISIKTVEAHISKALVVFRKAIKNYY